MLLYLTSNANIGVFDFLSSEGFVVKKYTGEFSLLKFVSQDMRNFNHCAYIAFDLKAILDKDEEIIEAVKVIKLMYNARIIVYAEGLLPGSEILTKLIDENVFNIVTGTTITQIQSEIRQCISEDGMKYDDSIILSKKVEEEDAMKTDYLFNQTDIKVVVAGVMPRIGTTHTAFNLTNYLKSIGARVSYTEAGNNTNLQEVCDYYGFDYHAGGFYEYKGIDYYPNKKFQSGYNFLVFDLGELNETNMKIFKSFDVRILCCGHKPYELSAFNKQLENLRDIDLNSMFVFSPEPGRIKLKRYESENNRLFFSKYAPSLFDGEPNQEIFKKILKDYIAEI